MTKTLEFFKTPVENFIIKCRVTKQKNKENYKNLASFLNKIEVSSKEFLDKLKEEDSPHKLD